MLFFLRREWIWTNAPYLCCVCTQQIHKTDAEEGDEEGSQNRVVRAVRLIQT